MSDSDREKKNATTESTDKNGGHGRCFSVYSVVWVVLGDLRGIALASVEALRYIRGAGLESCSVLGHGAGL